VLDSTAGQAKRAWAGGHELSALNTKTRPHAILFNKIAVMSSGACNLASCSSAALLDTRHALVADPEPFARLVVSNSPQRARWRRLCSAGQGGPEDLIDDPDRQGQV
jgi:hypothetical protein